MPVIGGFVIDENGTKWDWMSGVPHLRRYHQALAVQLPDGARGFVNGLPILGGFQAVFPGDLVRILEPGRAAVTYVVGGALPHATAGKGRLCRFTGRSITGEALCCGCGAYFLQAVAEQLGDCPLCGLSLQGKIQFPAEVLL